MRTETARSSGRRLFWIIAPQLFFGLMFIISGTGKLPGQAEFADVLLKSFWSPTMAFLIAHLLPWAELCLGIALVLNIFPRFAALLGIPLICGFISNNGWALAQGMEKYPACGYCFGVFEEIIGSLSPFQSLMIDLAVLASALAIVILHPDGFFSLRPWVLRRKVATIHE